MRGIATMDSAGRVLLRKLREHSRLSVEDAKEINALAFVSRPLAPNEDVIRQGDEPEMSILVMRGMLARYHLLPDGRRQYLSFHMSGDLPDAQALFVQRMDHSVCALGPAEVSLIPHQDLIAAFERRPEFGFAIWRETLVDA